MDKPSQLISYHTFAHQVSRKSRYFWNPEINCFIDAIRNSVTDRVTAFKVGELVEFWRARLGCKTRPYLHEGEHIYDEPVPYPNEDLKPIPNQATEGRANPKGIPVLYVATDRITAVSEIRPWIGAQVSVARMDINKDIRIVDCSVNHEKTGRKIHLFREPDEEERLEDIWTDIDKAFARPVTASDRSADYVPTQILTELFKDMGYDGITFKSSVADGYNLVLFDLDAVTIKHRQVVEITKAEFNCKWSGGDRFRDLDDD